MVTGRLKPRWWRALTPEQETAVIDAAGQGVRPPVLASAYGVSRRTIYRILERRGCPSVSIEIGGWRATFVMTEDGPVQATLWYPSRDLGDKSLPAHRRASENQGATPLISEAHP